jgi:polyhydroxyalkanoate synthesis regulator phasin
MFGIRRKAAIAATTAIFGTALLGGTALAAFAPAQLEAELVAGVDGAPSLQGTQADRADKLKQILAALVTKGVITQTQADAILAAVSGDRANEDLLRRVLASLFDQSATYLEIKPADLRAALPGTSLGAIADKTKGKAALVIALNSYVNGAIDKAVAEKKITPDQATKAKSAAPDQITKFVDHTYPAKKAPGPVTPKAPRAAVAPRVESFIADATIVARDYLVISNEDLATNLRSGKSLGEVAAATTGKTRTGLIATIAAATNTRIDKAQQDGKLTADQATALKTTVLATVTQLVDRKGTLKATRR